MSSDGSILMEDIVSAPIQIEAQPTPSQSNIVLQIENVNSRGEPLSKIPDRINEFTPETDLSNPERKIWVVTTASMPWRTGTSVNPLMRALFLTRHRPSNAVTLVIPWLEDEKSRNKLYGAHKFASPQDQEEWVREYARTRCQAVQEESNLRIVFWKGSYHEGFGSIFPTEDICALIPSDEADVAILEEPEHLNWFRVPSPGAKTNDEVLGWAFKFKHVVGVLHTNYAAYIQQYGMGTSFVTAPALNALSSLVCKAYCHRLIRLSATLPCLDEALEVTSNVHGVRSEFLDPPSAATTSTDTDKNAAVYFVGKLIWAKGFDKVLEVQEAYKEFTGNYFAIDVYGGGDDMKAIQRGFFGRKGVPESASTESTPGITPSNSTGDLKMSACDVFGQAKSLRLKLSEDQAVATETENIMSDDEECEQSSKEDTPAGRSSPSPLNIIGDIGGKTINTGVETAGAAVKMIESIMEAGLGAFRKEKDSSETTKKRSKIRTPAFMLGPARSRFKWRQNPIPARFLGVQDHIMVRDIPEQKIFLNMSITEVLCTTSAEALAMGKFVILPKHPSNEFFYAFPNCLAYDSMDDCVGKLQYALQNDPEPMTDKYMHMLSWEGATERLFDASGLTLDDANELEESGQQESREKAAQFHVGSARKSRYISDLLSLKMLKRTMSPSPEGQK